MKKRALVPLNQSTHIGVSSILKGIGRPGPSRLSRFPLVSHFDRSGLLFGMVGSGDIHHVHDLAVHFSVRVTDKRLASIYGTLDVVDLDSPDGDRFGDFLIFRL